MREMERVFLNQKKKKPKKVFISQEEVVVLNEKEKTIRKVFTDQQKNLFESKTEEIKKNLHDPITDRDEKIEEIKKILYDPKNYLSKQEEDNYKPERIGNAFISNYIEYKSN